MGRDQLFTVAGDLTFKTLLSLVPILVMVLVMLDLVAGAQIGQRVLGALFDALHVDALQISADGRQVDAAARINDLVAAARERISAAAVLGFVFLFVLAMNMLATMEAAMNRIWSVMDRRSWWRKAAMFWMVLTLGPLLGAGAVNLSGWLAGSTSSAPAWLVTAGRFVIELVAVWGVLVLVYKALPHTRVRIRAAFAGALVAGTLWHLVAKNAFGFYLQHAVNYTQVFGSIAVVPLFFLWIYITWIVVLFGCELAYVWQNLNQLLASSVRGDAGPNLRSQMAAITVAADCARRYLAGRGPSSLGQLARVASADRDDLDPALDRLVAAGVLARVADQDEAQEFLPARPPDEVTVAQVLDALGEPGGAGDRDLQRRVAALMSNPSGDQELSSTSLAALADAA